MPAWRIEAEDEVDTWLMKLSTRDAARTRFYLQLLTEHGNALTMPHVRSLGGGYVNCGFIFAMSSDASRSG
jgi:hypothetical protein